MENNINISHPKHILWILKITVLMRRLFWVIKNVFELMDRGNITRLCLIPQRLCIVIIKEPVHQKRYRFVAYSGVLWRCGGLCLFWV